MINCGGIRLSAFFTPAQVAVGVEGAGRDEVVRILLEKLAAAGRIKNVADVLAAVIEREKLLPTQLAPGLALPHTRLEDIDKLVLAVATSRQGIEFDSGRSAPTHVVVLILTPVSEPGLYLQTLAAVATLFSAKDAVERLSKMARAEDVWEFFDKGATALPQYVTARDMMSSDFVSLKTTDYLARAIDLFAYQHLLDIPVIDEDGDLAGIMDEERLLKLALPEYILWLQDLSPIIHFEPFAEISRNEHTLRIAEVMSSEYATVPEDAPAIQVARILMQRVVRAVLVVRGKKLVGVIRLSDFLTRVLRR